jgi:hypothetical protein
METSAIEDLSSIFTAIGTVAVAVASRGMELGRPIAKKCNVTLS